MFGLVNRENTQNRHARRRPKHSHHKACRHLSAGSIQRTRLCVPSGDQAQAADLAATLRTIGVSDRSSIADKLSCFVGPCRSFHRSLLTELSTAKFPELVCSQRDRAIVHREQARSHRRLWCFSAGELRQALSGDVEQVVAVLGQQVQGADDLRDVARFGLFETRAIKCF
ncbi:hypothetical protein PS938_01327 [Pseudomonas fluorescens]|uniref:Uncharacterized protein n=1 Tax=Pseudomonas fluorescens TaxID=294 RepID=A0A5E7SN76_PSEFL|nr:hypothetical protein PS938_01327 [Pseudomonas fluorescens]